MRTEISSAMASMETGAEFNLSPEQKYEFDLRGYIVLENHYDSDRIAACHAGIDELQAIPIDFATYRKLGVSSPDLGPADVDPHHPFWNGKTPRGPIARAKERGYLAG